MKSIKKFPRAQSKTSLRHYDNVIINDKKKLFKINYLFTCVIGQKKIWIIHLTNLQHISKHQNILGIFLIQCL